MSTYPGAATTYIDGDERHPAKLRLFSDIRITGLQSIKLGFEAGRVESGTWISLRQARELAAALVAHADAFETQQTEAAA